MKTKFLFLFMSLSFTGFSQSNSISSTFFSLTPRSNKELIINGLAIGAGVNISEKNAIKQINGLNVEVNPFSLLIVMFDDPSRRGFSEAATVSINGISIGTGHSNQNEDIAYRGLEVSLFNTSHSCNGISINGIYNYATNMNGIHVSTLLNYSKNANGLFLSFSNHSEKSNGLQIGFFNTAETFKGIQIGVLNKTKNQKGLQIGFWNINAKRSMPFLNW